jgi:hypothetical protein
MAKLTLTKKQEDLLYLLRSAFFNMKWENGNDSINDLLRRGLRELGFEYINDFSGVVWFLYYDAWERCTHEVKDRDGAKWVHFYLCKFAD